LDQQQINKVNSKKRNSNTINLKKSQLGTTIPQQQPQQQQTSNQTNQKDNSKSSENNIFNFLSRKHCACANLIYNKSIGNIKNRNSESSQFSLKTTQDMLIIFTWILKNIDKKLLFQLWQNWSYNKLNKILILIDLCVNHFEYRSTVWSSTLNSRTENVAPVNDTAVNGQKPGKQSQVNSKKQNSNFGNAAGPSQNGPSSASNSKLKNKIEDLIIGTQSARNEFTRRNKYFSYTSLNPMASEDSNDLLNKGHDLSVTDSKPNFKWRRDLNNLQNNQLDNVDSIDSMKLVLEGKWIIKKLK
jgi:hypothetical protein